VVAFDLHGARRRAVRPKHDRGSERTQRHLELHAIAATRNDGFPAGAVVGKPITSAHQSKTLEPTWREVHEFDVEDGSLAFKCVVEDYDALSKADHMGEVIVALS
jgi:hypothetical protein